MGNDRYKGQQSLSLLLVLTEAPNFIIAAIIAFTTRSLVVYMDLIDSTGNLLRALFMYVLMRKLKKNLKGKYNYGIGKLEALSTVCLDVVMLASIAVMVCLAIRDLIDPQPQPLTMGLAVMFKVCCVAGDAYVFYRQRKICSRSDSLVLKAELAMRIKNLIFDSTALVAVFLIFAFHQSTFVMYFSPVVCMLLAVWLTVGIVKRMRQAIREILDEAPDKTTSDIIRNAIVSRSDCYESYNGFDSRTSGGVIFVDMNIDFSPTTTYEQIRDFVGQIYTEISEKLPECRLSVQIKNLNPLPDSSSDTTATTATVPNTNIATEPNTTH